MKQFLMKWVNVILIVGLIAGYNLIGIQSDFVFQSAGRGGAAFAGRVRQCQSEAGQCDGRK